MQYQHTYQVVGSGRFPIDMLRYDGSYPRSEGQDSSAIDRSMHHDQPPEVSREILIALGKDSGGSDPKRGWVVTLVKDTDQKAWRPEAGRWASFLWYVVPGSHRVERR